MIEVIKMKKNDYVAETVYITIPEAAQQFFCGRITEAALYRLAREGKLPIIRVGRRILIDAIKMERMYA
jgi:excisionase family DNA binding protein